MTEGIRVTFEQETVRKSKRWRGLTTLGRGLLLILSGMLAKTAGCLLNEVFFSFHLTTIGIITFVAGLYIAIPGMGGQFKELKEVQFEGIRKGSCPDLILKICQSQAISLALWVGWC